MRIDSLASAPYASQRPQASATDRPAATSFSVAPAASEADGARQVDFTSMTRREMRDWLHARTSSGEMSLEESWPFFLMIHPVSVGGGSHSEQMLELENDETRYDFVQMVLDGIQGARSNNDEGSLKDLKLAMQTIRRYQSIGVDARA